MFRRAILAASLIPVMARASWPFGENGETTPTGVHIISSPEDRPAFERTYIKRLDSRAEIKVTISYFMSGIMKSGTLTQPDGKYVFFEPDAVADKILDPTLVPLVQDCVDEIFRLDAAFRNPGPTEFTDKAGVTWRRETS